MGSISKELDIINQMSVTGEFHEAIDKLNLILKVADLTTKEKIIALILKSKCLARLGWFEVDKTYFNKSLETSLLAIKLSERESDVVSMIEAKYWFLFSLSSKTNYDPVNYLEEIKQLEKQYNNIRKEKISLPAEVEALILLLFSDQNRAKILTIKDFKWDYASTFRLLEEAENIVQKSEDREILMLIQGTKAYFKREIQEYDESLTYYDEALQIAKDIGNDYFKSWFLYEIGGTYWLKGEYNLLFEYQKKALEIREKQKNERGVGQVYNRIGIYYTEIGEFKQGLDYFQKSYDILSENGKREEYSYNLNNIGALNSTLGNMDEALKCFETVYQINKKNDFLEYANLNLLNIAAIHSQRGEFDNALELYLEVLAYREQTSDRRGIEVINSLLGGIYRNKGKFDIALEYWQKYLAYVKELDVKPAIASSLISLIAFASEIGKFDLANKYYSELLEVIEQIDIKIYKKLALAGEALILKNSDEPRDRIRAEALFDQLLLEEFNYSFYIEILFQLCNLLLTELKTSSDEKILTKLEKHVSKLIEIGITNKLPKIIVESLWFKAQLSLLDLNFDKARELLNEALRTAEDKGYNFLALKMMKSKEDLINQTMALEETVKKIPTISERMEVIKIKNNFDKFSRSEMYQFKQNI